MKNNTYYQLFEAVHSAFVATNEIDPTHNRRTNKEIKRLGDIETVAMTLLTIRRLAKKHHRLAEMSCNGQGFVRGVLYTTGPVSQVPGYEKAQYGFEAKTAYLHPNCGGFLEELTIFDSESHKVEEKIRALCAKIGFTVEFQGDPRGNTVKLAYKGRYVEIF